MYVCISQASLELTETHLRLSPECWDKRGAPSPLAHLFFFERTDESEIINRNKPFEFFFAFAFVLLYFIVKL